MRRIKRPEDGWISYLVPLFAALIACGVLVLSPVWAYQWYRLPFIGAFLEPNLVVSQIGGPDWPAIESGVRWSDRLVAVEGNPVSRLRDLERFLVRKGYQPVSLEFERMQGGQRFQVEIIPRPVKPAELITQFVVPYLVGLALLASGLWANRLGWRQRPARAFLLFTAATSILTTTFLDMNTSHHFIPGWSLSLPIAAGALAHLALVFPQPMSFVDRSPGLRFFPWLFTILLAIPATRDILFPVDPWGYILSWRRSYIFIAASIVFFVSTLMVRAFRGHTPIVRQQSRIIIFGTALAFGPILFLYLVPSSMGLTPEFQTLFYTPPLVVLPISVAYAIVRYRLLDVDRVLSNAVAYGLITIAAVAAFYLLVALFSFLLQTSFNPSNPIIVATYLFLLVVALNPLRRLMQSAIDRLFYRTRADYRRVLTTLSRDLIVTPNLQQTSRLLERELNQALSPQHLLFYLYDDDRQLYLPHGNRTQSEPPLPPESALTQLIDQSPETIWLPSGRPLMLELPPQAQTEQTPAILNSQVFVPLRFEGRLIGFIALGARRSGTPYNGDDLEFLGAVANQSSLALENARLFTNLQRTLDETLEMKNLMVDIFASIASGVITTDVENMITLFNQAAERILGIPAAQALGKSIPLVLPSLSPVLEAMTEATLRQGRIILNEEANPVLPERGQLYLRLSCAPLRDARQSTKGATIVIDDLTEQRETEAERERIRQTFGRVVAPRVRDRLLSEPSSLHLEGIRQPITVLFADLHNFTSFSEHTTPEKLLEVLNSYFSLGAQAILAEEGTLDKFIGDAVMAFWNAPDQQPDHTLRAVRAALAMDRAVREHRSSLHPEYRLYFKTGITCGEAMVGNVGTTELFNYTAIGDIVNLAQRLQAAAEPGQILLSETVYQSLSGQVIARQLPPIQVKGRQNKVNVYELHGLKT